MYIFNFVKSAFSGMYDVVKRKFSDRNAACPRSAFLAFDGIFVFVLALAIFHSCSDTDRLDFRPLSEELYETWADGA